jgi:hypothetical protein
MVTYDVFSNRRKRLHALVASHGGIARFANRYQYAPTQISQYLSATYNEGRSIGERAARQIEERAGLSHGWLDIGTGSAIQKFISTPIDELIPTGEPGILDAWRVSVEAVIRMEPDESRACHRLDKPYITEMFKSTDSMYGIRIDVNHFAPRIRPGEVVIVDPQREIRPGDDVFVQEEGGWLDIGQYLYTRGNRLFFNHIDGSGKQIDTVDSLIVSMSPIVAILNAPPLEVSNEKS